MKGFPTLHEYLQSLNLPSDSSIQLIEKHKKAYRKAYLKEYRTRNSKSLKRLSIRLHSSDFNRLQQQMKKHNKSSMASFITESALAYIDNEYLYPDKDSRDMLIEQFVMISNNISSVCSKVRQHLLIKNLQGQLDVTDLSLIKLVAGYEIILTQIGDLEKVISDYTLTPPPRFVDVNFEEIRSNPKKLKETITYLLQLLDTL